MMTFNADDLLTALRVVQKCSGGMIECSDIKDIEEQNCDHISYLKDLIDGGECLDLWVPGEGDNITFSVNEVLRASLECESIEKGNIVSLRTKTFAMQLITAESEMAEAVLYHNVTLPIETTLKACVAINHRSLPVGVYASRIGAYEKHFLGACTSYPVVEIDFSSFEGKRDEQLEKEIVDSYLFELASSHNIVFSKSEFLGVDESLEPWWATESETPTFKLRPLEGLNEGISLYLAAAQVSDPELRFFSFFKVLEYFAPVVLNLETHDSLRKKLDSPDALAPAGRFIREVLQLAKSFDQRKNDRDLIKGVLLTGADLIGLNERIPASMRREVSYESSQKEIDQYARDLADSICATRNQVAHAKATYEVRGTECRKEDLGQFNEFLSATAAEVIRWYNRLPEHLKAELIADTH